LIVYAESHDEERVSFKVRTWGNSSGDYNTKNRTAERKMLVACFWAPLPGPKMIWQFGEFAYDIPINYCYNPETGEGYLPDPNGPNHDRCRTGRKPLLWDYLDDYAKRILYYVYSEMNKFRLTHSAFQNQKSFTYQTANGIATNLTRYIIAESNIADSSMVILGNFDVVSRDITVSNIPANGIWYNYFGQDSVIVSNNSITTMLNPGQFMVLTKEWKDNTSIENRFSRSEIPMIVYPNPAQNEIFVNFETEESREIALHNINGGILQTLKTRSKQVKFDVSNYKAGLYFITVSDGTKISSQKIVVR
jgi:hypothetical protein